MTEPQVDALLALVAQGRGVEAGLREMGLDIPIALEALKGHPSAKGRIKDAKVQLAVARQAVKL